MSSGIMFAFDILMSLLLGVTIFFAVRLNKHLSIFRSNRAEMERLIRELSTQITRAQEGISALDELSATRGDELRRLVAKGQGLHDELALMAESGNALAERLEKLAVKNREIAESIGQNTLNSVYPAASGSAAAAAEERSSRQKYGDTLPRADKKRVTPSLEPSFAIRDPDFEAEAEPEDDANTTESGGFLSKAERDLASILRKRTPKS